MFFFFFHLLLLLLSLQTHNNQEQTHSFTTIHNNKPTTITVDPLASTSKPLAQNKTHWKGEIDQQKPTMRNRKQDLTGWVAEATMRESVSDRRFAWWERDIRLVVTSRWRCLHSSLPRQKSLLSCRDVVLKREREREIY